MAEWDERYELERRRFEIQELRRKIAEDELEFRRMVRKDLEEDIALLTKIIPIVDHLPHEMRETVLSRFSELLEIIAKSPYELKQFRLSKRLQLKPEEQNNL